MARPIILGVVGDSAAGKTTISRGLVAILGPDNVTHIGTDDYHRYDRKQRAEIGITPLHPDCNHMDIIRQHLRLLRDGEPILKPVYHHHDGTFGPPEYVLPNRFVVIEGLLGYHSRELSDAYDVRVFLAPPEDLRRTWKVRRDTAKRGYTEQQVLDDLDRREPDSEAFIRPQRAHADIVISFQPGSGDDDKLDAVLVLREGLPHPDLSVLDDPEITIEERAGDCIVRIPGDLEPDRGAAIEAAIWDKMHFAQALRSERLGGFTAGEQMRRSESLAIVQVLILYHLVTAKAAVAVSGDETSARTDHQPKPREARSPAGAA